ncbi:MAG: GspE/PulE family protein [Pseudomonadota bacterium]
MSAQTDRSSELIGKALVEKGLLQAEDWDRATSLADQSSQNIHVVLDRLGLLAQEAWARAAAKVLSVRFVELDKHEDLPVTHPQLTLEFQREHKVAVIAESENGIALAMANPADAYVRRAVELACGKRAVPCAASERAIDALLRGHSADADDTDTAVHLEDDLGKLKSLASDAPVVRFVDDLIADALKKRASDIHLEPFEKRIVARLRIDGMLETVEAPAVQTAPAIVSRIKILAGLDIAERRLPQDGRIRLRIDGRDIDLRVATSPSLHGESVVMRVLPHDQEIPAFKKLGFDDGADEALTRLLRSKHGMIAVTGPTGSGKTTTLYSALDQLNNGRQKILTVEDPVEYQIDGVIQMPVNAEIGRTFAASLRSILRQDPDIIMVGEMRDSETAQIAAQAALTGHLVLSTLHTNDAPSAITRLQDMGLEPYLIASTLRAALSQRLVRRLCTECREPIEKPPSLPGAIETIAPEKIQFYRAVGCKTCNERGFTGRLGVFELLTIDEDISRLIVDGSDANILREAASAKGMRSLGEDALIKAALGHTSLEEAYAITGEG